MTISGKFKRLLSKSGSPSALLAEAAMLCVFYAVAASVPQRGIWPARHFADWEAVNPLKSRVLEFLGFTDMFFSPIVMATIAAFVAGLTANAVSALRETGDMDFGNKAEADIDFGAGIDDAKDAVRKAIGRTAFEEGCGRFSAYYFSRAHLIKSAFWISSIVLFAAAVGLVYTDGWVRINLAEGEASTGDITENSDFRIPAFGAPPVVPVRVIGMEYPIMYRGNSPGMAELSVGETRFIVAAGGSERLGGYRIMLDSIDVAPVVKLTGPDGIVYEHASVKLAVAYGGVDWYKFMGTDFVARFKFFPDYYKGRFGHSSMSTEMKNPAFEVEAAREGDGAVLNRQVLKPGDAMEFGGMRLAIDEIGLWGAFRISKRPAAPFLSVAAAAFLIAAAARILCPRIEIKGEVLDGKIRIAVRSDGLNPMNRLLTAFIAGKISRRR